VIENGKPKVDESGDPVMEPDPKWFQTRPSAVDYDGLGSSASQLGPNNKDLIASIDERRKAVAALEGVDPKDVPADAITASGSGLDPQISPASATLQVNRVARERGLDPARVMDLVKRYTEGRTLGFLGEPRVNVVELNAALATVRCRPVVDDGDMARGHLRIYLGAAPGVGKTYAMLGEGQRRH